MTEAQLLLFAEPGPTARASDPETSHAAPPSRQAINELQRQVLAIHQAHDAAHRGGSCTPGTDRRGTRRAPAHDQRRVRGETAR